MVPVVLYVVLAVLAAVGIWQLIIWVIEIQDKKVVLVITSRNIDALKYNQLINRV